MKAKIKKQVIINKYIERIKIDYPEDDKLMMDLQQFATELTALEAEEGYCTCIGEGHTRRNGVVICRNCLKPVKQSQEKEDNPYYKTTKTQLPLFGRKTKDKQSPQKQQPKDGAGQSAEEWLKENYHEFTLHCKVTGRSIPFFCNMLEEYAAQRMPKEEEENPYLLKGEELERTINKRKRL